MKKNKIFTLFIGITLCMLILYFALLHIGHKSDRIVLASLLPLAGKNESYGQMMQFGATIAQEEINSNTSGNKKKLDIVFLNTEHKKDVALERLKEAFSKHIFIIAEIFGSDQVSHCFNYAINNNILILSGVDTRYDLVEQGRGFFFRITPNDDAAVGALMRWAKNNNHMRSGILYVDDPWGAGLYNSAQRCAAILGINIIAKKEIESNPDNLESIADYFKEYNLDNIFLFVYPEDGGRFLKEARRKNLKAKYYATENFTGDKMIEFAQDAAIGVMLVTPKLPESNTILLSFNKKYKAKYRTIYAIEKEPTFFSYKAYDLTKFAYYLANKYNSDVDEIRKNIRNELYNGLTGAISFDATGEYSTNTYDKFIFVRNRNGIQIALTRGN